MSSPEELRCLAHTQHIGHIRHSSLLMRQRGSQPEPLHDLPPAQTPQSTSEQAPGQASAAARPRTRGAAWRAASAGAAEQGRAVRASLRGWRTPGRWSAPDAAPSTLPAPAMRCRMPPVQRIRMLRHAVQEHERDTRLPLFAFKPCVRRTPCLCQACAPGNGRQSKDRKLVNFQCSPCRESPPEPEQAHAGERMPVQVRVPLGPGSGCCTQQRRPRRGQPAWCGGARARSSAGWPPRS